MKETLLHLDCPLHGERSLDQVSRDTGDVFLCGAKLEGGQLCTKIAVPHYQFEETDPPVDLVEEIDQEAMAKLANVVFEGHPPIKLSDWRPRPKLVE